MKATPLVIPDVLLIEPKVFGDERGFFFESYNKTNFDGAVGRAVDFVQDNHSRSVKGVLRGLHYQLPPKQQGKLVRVVHGEIFDVAVDIRQGSPTFGQWVSQILSADNKKQLWIPEGFAHGFLTLSDTAEVLYKATNFYAPDLDRSIAWNEPAINIDWPSGVEPILSEKDKKACLLKDAEVL
ncbi:dTDP-4-dehydrorhamnose 3,5-epimerase [Guyparkeria sp. SB14A]|uniref:dTDP-4-dehydrorhamnose 3,5-epimerase n=1 Tax=Guyparkeria sp. SB14A TaxID=2571147 RepID=UPI0010AC39CC|nr:dTDP-4-dehydrorhamnose 3,5-epimerase [Guyparkeria sp. SB14A]TKA89439.1 dTDP-4-dehydrorhamnose 3,5-epimerase [Guyparkeria sp. SB14A]